MRENSTSKDANGSVTSTDGGDRRARDFEEPDKPGSPTQLTKPSWRYIVRRTLREFSEDQCTDLAAALTYYSILALFPALLVPPGVPEDRQPKPGRWDRPGPAGVG